MSRPKSTATCACSENCGAPVYARGLGRNCYQRAWNQGFPVGGPQPPVIPGEAGRRSGEARRGMAGETDTYDLAWQRHLREQRAREPVMRMDKMIAFACRFSAVVRRRDMHGVDVMLRRLTPADKDALLIALAETADPWQLMDVTYGERRSA